MQIRDVIHGVIDVDSLEETVLGHKFLQRLRNIKQLGFSEISYPSATHTRYSHSLGAMHMAGLAFDEIFKLELNQPTKRLGFLRLRSLVRLAALLHDVGHGPLSHASESAMPVLTELFPQLSSASTTTAAPQKTTRAQHEDYTVKILLESSLTPLLTSLLEPFHRSPAHVAALIAPQNPVVSQHLSSGALLEGFILDKINYLPLLQQLISSELDVDRLDYLQRDSYYTGVSYGKFDAPWILSHLCQSIHGQNCHLGLSSRALYTLEDFLISRFNMFLMVYFHHKTIIFDEMLKRYLTDHSCQYKIPSDIEAYALCDDHHLYTHLGQSENEWAQRIYYRKPYERYAEFHSHIPLQLSKESVLNQLKVRGIEYIVKTTRGEFSKYQNQDQENPLYIVFDLLNLGFKQSTPLHECSDLFQKYAEQREVTRIYVKD